MLGNKKMREFPSLQELTISYLAIKKLKGEFIENENQLCNIFDLVNQKIEFYNDIKATYNKDFISWMEYLAKVSEISAVINITEIKHMLTSYDEITKYARQLHSSSKIMVINQNGGKECLDKCRLIGCLYNVNSYLDMDTYKLSSKLKTEDKKWVSFIKENLEQHGKQLLESFPLNR